MKSDQPYDPAPSHTTPQGQGPRGQDAAVGVPPAGVAGRTGPAEGLGSGGADPGPESAAEQVDRDRAYEIMRRAFRVHGVGGERVRPEVAADRASQAIADGVLDLSAAGLLAPPPRPVELRVEGDLRAVAEQIAATGQVPAGADLHRILGQLLAANERQIRWNERLRAKLRARAGWAAVLAAHLRFVVEAVEHALAAAGDAGDPQVAAVRSAATQGRAALAAVDAGDQPAGKPLAVVLTDPPPVHIDPALIAAQKDTGWPDLHPEDYCEKCGHRNIIWYTESALWNHAVAGDLVKATPGPVWCPVCFATAYEQAAGVRPVWRLAPRDLPDEAGHLVKSEAQMRHRLQAAEEAVEQLRSGHPDYAALVDQNAKLRDAVEHWREQTNRRVAELDQAQGRVAELTGQLEQARAGWRDQRVAELERALAKRVGQLDQAQRRVAELKEQRDRTAGWKACNVLISERDAALDHLRYDLGKAQGQRDRLADAIDELRQLVLHIPAEADEDPRLVVKTARAQLAQANELRVASVERWQQMAEAERDRFRDWNNEARRQLAGLHGQITGLRALLREILARFTEHGHPGWPARRTGWIRTETVDAWQRAADQPVPGPIVLAALTGFPHAPHMVGHSTVYGTWDPDRATDEPDGLPDKAIVPLIETLRERGVVTLQSCTGHLEDQPDGSQVGRDGTLWVDAATVDETSLVYCLRGRHPFDRVQLVAYPDRWWELTWHADRAGEAIARLGGLQPVPADTRPADLAHCDTCSGTGWCKQEGQIGVPGSGCTHGCPDCEAGRTRLAAGELLEWDDTSTLTDQQDAPGQQQTSCCQGTGYADYAAVPCPNPECTARTEPAGETEVDR